MRNTKSVSIGFPSILWVVLILGLLLILGALPVLAASSPFSEAAPIDSYVLDTERPEVLCALLDDPAAREKMSGMFETKLLNACGRADELGRVAAPAAPAPFAPLLGPDVQVNDSTGESGATATQSETSLALNENTGTLCSGYNDSYSGVILGQGYTGFSNSTDGGATFTDRGALSSSSFGDPSLIWRRTDGKFYIATLHSSGLGIWRTDDDCETFVFHAMIHSGGGDDKELMAVDNNPASPYYGRIYTAWTDFNAGANIYSTYSDDGLTWSTPVLISNSGTDVQGAWPVVAPNGDVYVSWVRWNPYSTGPIDIEVVRSTNGGTSFSFVTNPLTGAVNPYDNSATSSCGRPALNGNIRYLPSPQIAVSPNGNLHVVYSYDPDGNGTGDVVDVFYRRSTDNGATWGTEVQLNDDGTTTDQWFPTVSAGPSGRIIATWYDRRSDVGGNYLFEYYMRVSEDGGATWQPSVLVSDVQSPVYLDPNLATCYHGDYDTQVQDASYAYIQWSDDRLMLSGHNDPDVWMDTNAFAPDFTLDAAPLSQAICVPGPAYYNLDIGQILSYTDPVTLSTSGVPGGYSDSYSTNPVIPPGTSVLTLTNIGAATPGAYSIDIIGTAPTSTHTATVGLDLYNTIPAAPTLVAPGDGAIDVPLVPTFSWTAVSQGALYDLEVAEDSGFTTLVYTSTVAGTSDTSGVALAPVTTYYWRVTPSNACGAGTTSAVFSFTTQDIPPVLLVDDDDNSPDVQGTYTAVLDNLLGPGNYDIWDTNNSDMEPTALDLAPYTTVIWFTGDEFGGFAGPGAAGEAALSSWLDGGNCMLISSQDYLYDRGLTPFIDNYLGVASYTSDVAQTSVTGAGSVYSVVGGPHALSYPGSNFSDLITPDAAPAELAFSGNAGDAAVDKDSGVYRTAFLGYPFEALPAGAVQEDVMLTTLNWCGSGAATGTLAGSVSDIDSGLGIDGAAVTAVSGAYMRTVPTDGAGDYTMQVPIGTYDVTADATGYLSDTITAVVVITDTTTVVDFVLQGSMLSYSPASIEEFMEVGDIVTNTVTVTNTGPVAIDWSASIGNYTPTVSMPLQVIPRGISVPASDGNFPRGAAAPSFGAPPALKEGSAPASAGQLRVPDGTSAYATDAGLGQVVQFDLDVPTTLNSLAPFAQFVWAGDFAGGDFSKTYALRDDNTLVTFDSLTGAATIIGVVPPPPGGETYTGMAYDASTGTMYASSCNITTSSLFTVDLGAPSTTLVGAITNSPCTIGIAVDDGGQMYGFDLVNDSLMSIDKATGAGTIIGSLGFDANFGQGMDWDSATGQLYLAAFNNGTGQAELRIADTTTGNTALVGALGTPGISQLGWVAIAAGGSANNWAAAVPDSGTIPANSSATFDVVFDSNAVFPFLGTFSAELTFDGTFVNMVPTMPLTMHLSCTTCGFLEGSITDALTSDPLVADIHVTSSGGFDVTLTGDSYSFGVQPGVYDFTVSANDYFSATASVTATQGVTTTTDFALTPMVAYLEYSPPEIEEFMVIGDVVTNTVTVTNSGTIPLDFNVNIGDYGEPSLLRLVPRGISIPASDGNFPRGAAAPSFGAPPALKESSTPASAGQLRVPDGTSAYATDAGLAQVVQFDLDVPATLNSLAPFAQFVWAGDFAGGDFSKTYALRDDNTLVTFDSLTGAATIIGVVPPPPGGETYTGMAYDASTGTMYASSCNITTSSLFTVDLGAPSTTLVGAITNSPCTIGIAVDDGGQMYGFDLVNDSLMSIDKATGAGTIIGSLGFDANFGQGMDWDSATGQLYLAAFNNGTFQAELRIADTTTGNTALVGALGTPGTSQLGWVAIAAGGSSSNWVYAVPDSGTVPAGGSTTFDVVFDATSLIRVGDYTAELSFSGNFDNMVPAMPLTMHLSCPTCGFLNGSITDANTTDPLVADVLIDGPGAFLLDLRADSYNIAVQPGAYDFTVSANGYLTETASVIVTQGVTVTTDFALVPAEAVLAYSPDRIEEWVTRGDAVTNTMLITNTGSIPLDFVLVDVETGNPAMPLIVRRAPAVTCPADIFGYTCTDSTEPDGLVAYNFEDISGTGTAVFLSDDEVSGPVPLGFDFNYYGADYPEIYISSNGFLTVLPGQSSGCCTGQPIPTAGSPDGVIAGWWDDLNPSSGGTIHYQVLGTAPFQYLVVQFTGVPHFGGGNEVTMQYKLFEGSNNIEVHYMAAPPDGTDHSAGIENDTGTDGVQYYFGGAGLGPDLAVCYLYPGQFACGSGGVDAAWAIESPDLGMILAGETLAVDVGFHSEVVTQTGTYTANLLFAGNYVNAVSPATLVMHVSDAGVQIGPDHSGSGAHGSQVVYDFTVMNTGWVTDTYSLSATHGTFTATLSTTTTGPLGPGESMDMTLTVDIPDDALFGEFDIATITATSTWDVNMSDSATATTTVVEYLYYFSFVPKN